MAMMFKKHYHGNFLGVNMCPTKMITKNEEVKFKCVLRVLLSLLPLKDQGCTAIKEMYLVRRLLQSRVALLLS